MRVFLLLTMISTLLLAVPPMTAAADDFDSIIGRQRDLLLAKPLSTPPAAIEQWVRTLDASGAWQDINYKDQKPADWSPRYHLDRVVTMCRALLQPQSPLRGDPRLAAAIDRALDHWIATRPHCSNWWHNDIGTPGFMRDVIFLLGDRLQGARRAGAMEVLRQYKVAGEGANLVWTATLALSDGCLRKDAALVADSAAKLTREIKVTTGEGIQPDYSYHQHGARLQEFHYGGAYLHDQARVAWMLAGTRFAVPPDKVQILVDYVLKGQQWMARWRYTVPSTLDRAVSRPDASDIGGDLDGNAAILAELSPKDRPALEEVRARLARRAPALNGFRAFPCSDFACYQRPDFSFFVKTISTRTETTESGLNGENTRGALLNSGDTYFLREGDEYANLSPVWDWTLLPGITSVAGLSRVDRQGFVGAVGDGESGFVAMDYAASDPHGPGKLHARKAYFCHGDAVVCLVGDLTVQAGDRPAQTALDQRLLRGPVIAADATGQTRTLSPGETRLQGVKWLYHDGFAYIPTAPGNLTVRLGPATGTWRAINASGSTDPVEKFVFLPLQPHGTAPMHAASGYAVLRCASPAQAAGLAQTPGYILLRNDADCQAVKWDDGTVMAAFYAPGELRTDNRVLAGADHTCLMLIHSKSAFVADPTGQGATVHLIYNEQASIAELPNHGDSKKFPIEAVSSAIIMN